MKHITKTFIIGRVGKIIPFDKMVKISIASSDDYQNRDTGDWHEQTRWNTVTVFREGLRNYVKNKLEVG